jgi:hypothetical protein
VPPEFHDTRSDPAGGVAAGSDAAAIATAEERLLERVRHEMAEATEAIAALSQELSSSLAPSTEYGQRLALVLSRRLQQVEGAVAVAMALADRTGVELRGELQSVAESLSEQLAAVAEIARSAAGKTSSPHDLHALEARFDEVHRRIDALTRELRIVSGSAPAVADSPYGQRLALTLGRRLEHVEGTVAVTSALAERVEHELRQELEDAAAATQRRTEETIAALSALAERLEALEGGIDAGEIAATADALRKELRAFETHVGEELSVLTAAARSGAEVERTAEKRLRELSGRVELVERDRDVMNARLVRAQETWAAERVALQERVAELAARIVTGPVPVGPGEGEAVDWPTARAFDQLRIAVEGVRMRLAYHEKAVAEIADARSVDERLIAMHQLLGRLESAEQSVRGERDSVQDQLERIAARIDWRLQQLETTAPGLDA